MVKFKGRLSIKQYIKIKPVKWGIKLFTLAESATGYVLNLIPYTGKRVDTDLSKTTQTVLDVAHDYMHLGHHLFMDNYYMSIELVSSLSGKDTLCCGTVNSNRVGLPADVKKTAPAVKQLERMQSLKRMRDGILAITWMDTRAVNLLTNIPNCLGDADVHRRDKKTGAEIVISRPTAIQRYNTQAPRTRQRTSPSTTGRRSWLVGTEDQTANVSLYNWQTFLAEGFRPLNGIKQHQHFRLVPLQKMKCEQLNNL